MLYLQIKSQHHKFQETIQILKFGQSCSLATFLYTNIMQLPHVNPSAGINGEPGSTDTDNVDQDQ